MRFIRLLRYVFNVAYQSITGSWTLHLVSTATIATAFVILGGALLLFQNVRSLLVHSEGQNYVSVYFSKEPTLQRRTEFEERFCSRVFVHACGYLSAKKAQEDFSKKNPELEDVLGSLTENPFPASMEIQLNPDYRKRDELSDFSKLLGTFPGVEAVDDGGDWLERWLTLLGLIDWAMWTLGITLSLALVFVVSNTIKLVVYARRDEVEIISLVGGSDLVIRAPFVIEGVVQGLLGSFLALFVLKLLFLYSHRHFGEQWQGMFSGQLSFISVDTQLYLLLGGALLGLIGSSFAVGRFLRT